MTTPADNVGARVGSI